MVFHECLRWTFPPCVCIFAFEPIYRKTCCKRRQESGQHSQRVKGSQNPFLQIHPLGPSLVLGHIRSHLWALFWIQPSKVPCTEVNEDIKVMEMGRGGVPVPFTWDWRSASMAAGDSPAYAVFALI